ncbi:uncharacterized protein LOC110939539 [Helianthus annuus]|uniref:uncharacterized protein LOC110939539 n=1 Tax=Helianthus annuus TaxID=4232 RepID=UPI000B8F0733|nr:uncharacterized protein LOC110939539 [Helianthus annuus]
MKWRWRFRHQHSQLWADVVNAIHGSSSNEDGIPLKKEITGIWKDLVLARNDLSKAGVTEPEKLGLVNVNGQVLFSVAAFREAIAERIGVKVEVGRFEWIAWAPQKVYFFVWRILNEGIAVKTNLDRRGVFVEDKMCVLCGYSIDSMEHLMFLCPTACAVWWNIWVWIKIPTNVQIVSTMDLLEWLFNLNGSAIWKKVILVISFATLWIIWKTRNERIFDGKQSRVEVMVDKTKEESFQWIKYRSPYVSLDWERWRDFNVRDIII